MYSLSKDISAAHLSDFSRITHCKGSAIAIYDRDNIKDGFKDQSKLLESMSHGRHLWGIPIDFSRLPLLFKSFQLCHLTLKNYLYRVV